MDEIGVVRAVDGSKAKLGRKPRTSLQKLVAEMVEADYQAAGRDHMVALAGFKAYDQN